MEQQPAAPLLQEQSGNGARTRFRSYLKLLVVTFLVALTLRTFFVEAYRIPSGSMENTLLVGDFVFVNKFVYGARTPRYMPLTNVAIPSVALPGLRSIRRGDVIVFRLSDDAHGGAGPESSNYIKRCVGLPGDTVRIVAGRLFVDGVELMMPSSVRAKPFASEGSRGIEMFPPGAGFTEDQYGPLVVPRRGDTIWFTATSFNGWRRLIEREEHVVSRGADGSVMIDDQSVSSYVVERNYYFVLGDNRANSLDSRYWGFVPEDDVVGEALAVYWSWDSTVSVAGLADNLKRIRWERIGKFIR